MKCHDIEPLLFAERDGVLTAGQHAALNQHVVVCPACQQLRARLAKAMTAYAVDAANVSMPDVEAEWQKLRLKLHERSGCTSEKTTARACYLVRYTAVLRLLRLPLPTLRQMHR